MFVILCIHRWKERCLEELATGSEPAVAFFLMPNLLWTPGRRRGACEKQPALVRLWYEYPNTVNRCHPPLRV